MSSYSQAPINIDVHVNLIPATCPKLWFTDGSGTVLESTLDCNYTALATGTLVRLSYYAPSGYSLSLQTKQFSALSPTISGNCSPLVTLTTPVPAAGVAISANYNVLLCASTGLTVVWHDPKWTVKKEGSSGGFTASETTELVRNDDLLTTFVVNKAGAGNASYWLSSQDSLFVGSTAVMRPSAAIATTYHAKLVFADPQGIGVEWSTDGINWYPGSAVAHNDAASGSSSQLTVRLRQASTHASLLNLSWVADNQTLSAPACNC